MGEGLIVTSGVGVGVGKEVGLGEGEGDGATEGFSAEVFIVTPEFQISFLPDLMQVNFFP